MEEKVRKLSCAHNTVFHTPHHCPALNTATKLALKISAQRGKVRVIRKEKKWCFQLRFKASSWVNEAERERRETLRCNNCLSSVTEGKDEQIASKLPSLILQPAAHPSPAWQLSSAAWPMQTDRSPPHHTKLHVAPAHTPPNPNFPHFAAIYIPSLLICSPSALIIYVLHYLTLQRVLRRIVCKKGTTQNKTVSSVLICFRG